MVSLFNSSQSYIKLLEKLDWRLWKITSRSVIKLVRATWKWMQLQWKFKKDESVWIATVLWHSYKIVWRDKGHSWSCRRKRRVPGLVHEEKETQTNKLVEYNSWILLISTVLSHLKWFVIRIRKVILNHSELGSCKPFSNLCETFVTMDCQN